MDIFIHSDLHHYYENAPITLVDLGASGGLQSPWESALPFLRVVGFEPEEDEFRELNSNTPEHMLYLNSGLYHKQCTMTLHVTRKQRCSSLLEPKLDFLSQFPNSRRFDVMSTLNVQVDTLDNQLSINGIQDLDFLKIDTQGSELFVLQGATQALQRAFGIEIEVEFNEMYKGQPLFGDVDSFLRKHGYQLFDLRRTYWKRSNRQSRGQIVSGDALYFCTYESFNRQIDALDVEAKRTRVLKAMSLCFLFSRMDFSQHLHEKIAAIFNPSEADRIKVWFEGQRVAKDAVPEFYGRKKLANALLKGHSIFKKSARKERLVIGDHESV